MRKYRNQQHQHQYENNSAGERSSSSSVQRHSLRQASHMALDPLLSTCLESNGVYICSAYNNSRCLIIQKVRGPWWMCSCVTLVVLSNAKIRSVWVACHHSGITRRRSPRGTCQWAPIWLITCCRILSLSAISARAPSKRKRTQQIVANPVYITATNNIHITFSEWELLDTSPKQMMARARGRDSLGGGSLSFYPFLTVLLNLHLYGLCGDN